MKQFLLALIVIHLQTSVWSQTSEQTYVDSLLFQLNAIKQTELIQSMSQRSLLIPSYEAELKALVARQAYDLWKGNNGEKLVSHKNIYNALYYANKYLDYDSINLTSYNQVSGHTESVNSIIFGTDSNIFYSAGSDGNVLKWNLKDLKQIPMTIYSGSELIKSIDLSHDGQILLINTKGKGIVFIDLKKPNEVNTNTMRDPEMFQEVTFFPNENKYLGINKQGQIRIKGISVDSTFNIKNTAQVKSIAISKNAETLYLGTDSGHLKLIENKELEYYAIPELFSINALTISHDQRLLAVGREKGDIILINLEENEIERVISGHQSAVTDVGFNNTDSLFLSASRDGTTKIWNTYNSRKLPIILDDHDDWVFTATFTPDGNQVVTGSKDKHIRVWTLDYQLLADRICTLISRNLTQKEWNEYIGNDIAYNKTCPSME